MHKSRTLWTIVLATLAFPCVALAQDDAPKPSEPQRPAQPARPMRQAAEAMRWLQDVEFVPDVVYATITNDKGEERELKFDAAFPKQGGDKPLPVVVYIHGGGWSGGSRNAGWPFCIAFANGGYMAVTIEYRLSGEATYPAAVHDCKAAIRFLRANAEQLGIDPNRIGVWGHSAGGHLSAMLGLTRDDKKLQGSVGTTGVSSGVTCFVSVSGPSALAGVAGGNMVADFLGGTDEQRPELAIEASPVTHVDANDAPALLVHGTDDPLVNVRQAHLLQEKMTSAGAKSELYLVQGGDHGIRDKAAYEKIAAFFDEKLGGDVSQVFDELDWQRLNELQPSRAPRGEVQRPMRPRADEQPVDAPKPETEAPRPNRGGGTQVPPPLNEETINAMTHEEATNALSEVAGAIRRGPQLDEATRDRLNREFKLLLQRVRETG